MLRDARDLLPDTEVETDVCVVGSGPAGQAVALGLDGLPVRVTVLESGGPEPDAALDDLGVTDPVRFGGLERVDAKRRLGGNASAWTVDTGATRNGIRLVPLSAADHEARACVPSSGWPLGADAFAPYVRRAQRVFGLPATSFEGEAWADDRHRALPLDPARVVTRVFQFGEGTAFTRDHPATLAASPNVTVLHHATALGLEQGPDGRVAAVRAASAPRRGLRIRAAHTVLAGGGLGTTQLLLASVAEGTLALGEAEEHLGRWFHDHLLLHGGRLIPAAPGLVDALRLYDLRRVGGVPVMGHLALADEALRGEPLLQLSAVLFPSSGPLTARGQAGVDAAVRVRAALRAGAVPAAGDVLGAARGLGGVTRRGLTSVVAATSHWSRGGWSALPAWRLRMLRELHVDHQAEQAPHRDNRVVLGEGRDAFGMRRVTVDWRWHDEDVAKTVRAQEVYAHELARAGVGRLLLARDGDGGRDGRPVVLSPSTGHYLGTTRMGRTPRTGVVDERCRVHGVDNLLVAAGSTFPTGGFANPTLSIVALALRIADDLKRTRGLTTAPPTDVATTPAASRAS